jgi:hypothetical protein
MYARITPSSDIGGGFSPLFPQNLVLADARRGSLQAGRKTRPICRFKENAQSMANLLAFLWERNIIARLA